jgi:ribosomal protein L22
VSYYRAEREREMARRTTVHVPPEKHAHERVSESMLRSASKNAQYKGLGVDEINLSQYLACAG